MCSGLDRSGLAIVLCHVGWDGESYDGSPAQVAAAAAGAPAPAPARWISVPIYWLDGVQGPLRAGPEPEPDEATLMQEAADMDAADEARRSEFGPHW